MSFMAIFLPNILAILFAAWGVRSVKRADYYTAAIGFVNATAWAVCLGVRMAQ